MEDSSSRHKKEEIDSLLEKSRNFGSNTSSHGIPRIVAATSCFGRVVWSCLYVVCLAVFVWQAYRLVEAYLKFEVTISYVVKNADGRKVDFPAITLCNTNQVRKSALAGDIKHQILASIENYTYGLQYYAPCKKGDFKCSNSKCVKEYRHCNGIDDCGDKSDEKSCTYPPCGVGYFMCQSGGPSGYCIVEKKKCDKVKDCYGGEDENTCKVTDITCEDNEMTCKTGVNGRIKEEFVEKYGTKYCIPEVYSCDGFNHCENKADETDCEGNTCGEDEMFCGDGKCIINDWKCDSICDCFDCRDEFKEFCTFTCLNGTKIPLHERCDYKNQCGDNSDEEGCPFADCNETEFKCNNKQCIDKSKFCDDVVDCYDHTDERPCNCTGFLCENRDCEHMYAQCNALDDCDDHSDEKGCQEYLGGIVYDDHDPSNWTKNWHVEYMKKLKIKKKDEDVLDALFPLVYNNWGFERIVGEFPPDWIRFLVYSSTPDYSDLQDVLKLTDSEIASMGHQRETMIIQCTYAGRKCDLNKHFHQFQHDKYGNCYTFNSNKKDQPVEEATRSGAENGLKLTLNTEQHEYVSIFGQESGFKVSIHNQYETPFPEESAITVSPGRATSIGIKKHELVRKGKPYGNCTDQSAKDRKLIFKNDTVYTTTACQKSCYQETLKDVCDCVDTLIVNDTQRCGLLHFEQERCRQLINYLLHSVKLIECDCPIPCREITYEKTVSQSLWPSDGYVKTLLDSIYVVDPKFREHVYDLATAQLFNSGILVGATVQFRMEHKTRRNLVRLEVYYEDLSYVSITESPAYTWESLFGDIGGTLGLYIGLSLLTVIEFIEFFGDVFLHGFKKILNKNKVQSVSGM